MTETILSWLGWNTNGFPGEHSVSDKSSACGRGIHRVKELKHSTLSAFSYFVLKTRAREGRKEVGRDRKGGTRKRGSTCPKRGRRLHWVPCENFPLLCMLFIKSRYSSLLLRVRGGLRPGDVCVCVCVCVSHGAPEVKNLPANAPDLREADFRVRPCNAGDLGSIPRFDLQDDPLEEGMATHSSILAWRIPCTEEPGGMHSIAVKRSESHSVASDSLWRHRRYSLWKSPGIAESDTNDVT